MDFIKSRQKCNLFLVLINIAVFVVLEIMGSTTSPTFMAEHGAAYTPLILEGQYWRLFTAMFLHFGFEHLAYNMFSLLFLGDILESAVGHVKFLIIYMVGGIGGNVISLLATVHSGDYKIAAGASGAIFAVMGAFFFIALRNRNRLGKDFMRRLGMMVVLMIMQGLVDKGVDQTAHVGGLVCGFVLGAALYHPRNIRVRELEEGGDET